MGDLKETQKGIDGEDISGIMGVNKFMTIYEVYLNKVVPTSTYNKKLLLYNEELREEEYWKLRLKEIIANEFSIRSGKKVRKENKQLIDEEY